MFVCVYSWQNATLLESHVAVKLCSANLSLFGLCFWYVLLCFLSNYAIILTGCFALIVVLVSCDCMGLWLFPKVSCVGLRCVIVVIADYTHLYF